MSNVNVVTLSLQDYETLKEKAAFGEALKDKAGPVYLISYYDTYTNCGVFKQVGLAGINESEAVQLLKHEAEATKAELYAVRKELVSLKFAKQRRWL